MYCFYMPLHLRNLSLRASALFSSEKFKILKEIVTVYPTKGLRKRDDELDGDIYLCSEWNDMTHMRYEEMN